MFRAELSTNHPLMINFTHGREVGHGRCTGRGWVLVQMAKEQSCKPEKSLLLRAKALIPQLGHHSCLVNAQKEPQPEVVISTTTPRGGKKPQTTGQQIPVG